MMDSEKLNSFVEKGKEIATEAARAAKEVAELAVNDVKTVVSPQVHESSGPDSHSESKKDESKNQVEDAAKQALTAIGGFFEQAGHAIKNAAESATKSDLDRDGSIGKPKAETEQDKSEVKTPESG